jgi:hypothetical protein
MRDYNVGLNYTPNKANVVADALSRKPIAIIFQFRRNNHIYFFRIA